MSHIIAALEKRQHGPTWRKVPKLHNSRWGFLGLMIALFVIVVVFFIVCICCLCRRKKNKKMKYAAQGDGLATTHPEPTYGRKDSRNKPARRPLAGTQNGGYGNTNDSDSYIQQPQNAAPTSDSNYNRHNYAAAGAGAAGLGAGAAAYSAHHRNMQETGSATNSRYGAPSSYNGGYGGYGEGQGAGYGSGYNSEYDAQAGQHGGYEGGYEGGYGGPQQFTEAPVGMAYSHDRDSAYGAQPSQAAHSPAGGYEAAQPAAVQPGAYSSYDQQSHYSHGPQDYAGGSQHHGLPQPPSMAAMAGSQGSRASTPQAHTFYNTPHAGAGGADYAQPQPEHYGGQAYGSQTFDGYAQHGQEAQEGYGHGAASGGEPEPPAYYSYDNAAPGGSSAAGPSSSAATAGGMPGGLPGNFQLPPEKSRDI